MTTKAPPEQPKSARRRNRKFFLVLTGVCLCGCGGLVALPFIVVPLMIRARIPTNPASCLTNIKGTGLAVQLYAADFDHFTPPERRWCEATMPYVNSYATYRCPAVSSTSYGYALNDLLSGRPLDKSDPKAVLLFEPLRSGINAHGFPSTDADVPGRHAGKNNFAFVDGSVKALAKAP